ncbi:MAG: DUF58 domain-containing protein [Pseudomonadota bacterium]|nr:DUF58 domain-containing protein [Pseudomonadota bacterium]
MRPERPLVVLVGTWTLVGIAASWWPAAVTLWQVAAVALGGTALADLLWLLRLPPPRLERRMSHTLSHGVWSRVRLGIGNPARQPVRILVHDLHPSEFEVAGLPRTLRLEGGERVSLEYRLRPPQRGDFELPGCDLRLRSPLGLWARRRTVPLPAQIRVYPNFAEISHYTLLATNDRLGQLGVRLRQRRGSGAEFHQLREYRSGDSLRQIDWKATSRVRKLISKEYQEERDQRLVFLLDCGRRMRHAELGRGHLDEALNALLLLAYVAVRQGDAVGLMTYGGPRRWFAPRKEPDTVNRLLNAIYDLQPTLEASDPLLAARELMKSQTQRSMVVLLTNSRDEDEEELVSAIRLLRRRHLVVVADLRESILDRTLASPVASREGALRFLGVQAYLEARRRHHERLHHNGADVLDLLPHQLPIALVNQYLAVKRAGAL